MKTNASNINIKNKRASFDYEFIDTYTAGIVLTGTEIKSSIITMPQGVTASSCLPRKSFAN